MVGILVIGVVLVVVYIYYWWDYWRKQKIKNHPTNIKLRVSKEFQDIVLSSPCRFKFKIGDGGKTYYKMMHFEPCDSDSEIIIVLEKSNEKEEIDS